MISEKVTVVSKQGLHARPANQLVQECRKFDSEIYLLKDGKKVNAKSLFAILQCGIGYGCELAVECEGADEKQACSTIVSKIKTGLGER